MTIKIDGSFEDLYKLYFKGRDNQENLDTITRYVNYLISPHLTPHNIYDSTYSVEESRSISTDILNIIVTSSTIGSSYTECEQELLVFILTNLNLCILKEEEIEKAVFCVIINYILANTPDLLSKYFRAPRNIYAEVAATYFDTASNNLSIKQINYIKTLNLANGYSIEDEPVTNWDEYYFNICRETARNSKCFAAKIGAILVKDKRIVSTGYNGPPEGVPSCDNRWKLDEEFNKKYKGDTFGDKKGKCPRRILGFKSGEGTVICPAGHAERNSLISAARLGIATKGTTMYVTCGIPCTPCLVEIINSGVEEVVVTSLRAYDETNMYVLQQSDLKIRLYNFIK